MLVCLFWSQSQISHEFVYKDLYTNRTHAMQEGLVPGMLVMHIAAVQVLKSYSCMIQSLLIAECLPSSRCYEVRCVTGVVVGNFSSNGAAIPFNTSRGFTEPGLDLSTVQDDYGRTYAGNPLKGEEQLFTQCWNDTLVRFCSIGVPTQHNADIFYVRVDV